MNPPLGIQDWDAVFDRIDATIHVDPEEALELCRHVFSEAYLWEPRMYVRAAERYGKIMDHLGRSSEARASLFAAQQAAQGSCLPICEAKILERLARSYYTDGDYPRAMRYWNSCIDVLDYTSGDAETYALAKVGLAQLHKGDKNYVTSQALLTEAEARSVEVGDPHLDAKVKINLAVVLIEQDRTEEASTVLHQVIDICREHQLLDYLSESNLYLGKIALGEGALERALSYVDAGLAAARQVGFRWAETHLLAVQAEVLAKIGTTQEAHAAAKTQDNG